MAKALIFIPDISGYTSFVHQTETKHQNHILEELLDLLIDSNDLGLKLAEVEGDALFYYQDESLPNLEEVIALAESMYIKFHSHLLYYDTHRLCHCGACQNATGLSLKFVIHYGEVSYLNIKGRSTKPHGIHVIKAHRLLKNQITSDEYILKSDASNQLSRSAEKDLNENWVEVTESYGQDDVGDVDYSYRNINDLRSRISIPKEIKKGFQSAKPIRSSIEIKKLPLDLFEMVLNHNKRVAWNPFIEDITLDDVSINQVGQEHTCIIQGKENKVVSVNSDFGEKAWVLGEKGRLPILGDIFTYFIIKPINDFKSEVVFEAHAQPETILGRLFAPIFKKKMSKAQIVMLEALKSYAEKEEESEVL